MLDKFFNVKPKSEKMEIEGETIKKDSLMPWVEK